MGFDTIEQAAITVGIILAAIAVAILHIDNGLRFLDANDNLNGDDE